jgi:hypothetical protein
VSTLLQLMRVAFWMLPVQRVLTIAGALVVAIALANQEINNRINLPGTTLPMLFLGWLLILLLPLLLGGAWLRVLSAPRFMQMLPHARGRLLTGAIIVVMLGALVWIIAYWMAFQRLPLQLRPAPEQYLLMYMLTLTCATQCTIGVFIASRGPLWLLAALVLWTAPHFVLPWLGFDDRSRLLAGPVGAAMVLATWVVFGAWFLKTRRIGGEGWRRGSSNAAASTAAASQVLTREQAMARWLLGAATPTTLGALWTAGVTVLLGVQLLIGRNSPARAVSAMAFGTLSLNAVVVAAIAWSAAARSRGLWLTGARLRDELYGWCERLLVRVVATILLPFVLLGVALWLWLPETPGLPLGYLLPAIVMPGLMALWLGLLTVRRSAVVLTLAGMAIVVSWYYGVAQPLAAGSGEPRWMLLGAQLAGVVVLRMLAARRWRSLDWPRGGRVQPLS